MWLALLAGCGAGDQLPTYVVTGKVTLPDGTPLPGGVVTFRSLEHKLSASGVIAEDGTCRMGTYKSGDGAVAGRHGVAIAGPTVQGDPDDPANIPKIKVAQKYSRPETSKLDFTVTPEGPNRFTFQVTPP